MAAEESCLSFDIIDVYPSLRHSGYHYPLPNMTFTLIENQLANYYD